jgi:signal transduction histidine kinase
VATAAFRETSVVEYSHRVFPVFVNLVNNALYWVTMREERRVLLDRRGHEIYVADTGPGVDPDDEDNLFDLFFTRRVEGHGVGLYLSRIALEQGRHQIRLAAPPERILPGANFIITFRELQDGQ